MDSKAVNLGLKNTANFVAYFVYQQKLGAVIIGNSALIFASVLLTMFNIKKASGYLD